MSMFPGFGGWIDQNNQAPIKADSKKSGNVKSKELNTHKKREETQKQLNLWRDAEKKEPWHDAPPKMKVKVERGFEDWGFCHVKINFTIGLPPEVAYEVLTNPDNKQSSRIINGRELLKNISRKVTPYEDWLGVYTEKALSWNFLWLSLTIPLQLSSNEYPKELKLSFEKNYNKKEMKCMEAFFGGCDLEPIYIDSKRLCKHNIEPESREEYEKCSGGQGRIATKVKMFLRFKPSSFYNLPPISLLLRWFTLKITKTLIEDFQAWGAKIRRA